MSQREESRTHWGYGESAGIDSVWEIQKGKGKESFLCSGSGGFTDYELVYMSSQEPGRAKTRVQVSFIKQWFLGAQGSWLGDVHHSWSGMCPWWLWPVILTKSFLRCCLLCLLCWETKKSWAPCPLQGGHALFALWGTCKVGVRF